ncbi:DMT family transporter [Thalassospira alkalitolerans]|uniref:DMT family transporter n=1 Tax=Thalassospira alkalitolerans TaxID=1293890 RepID=UPI0030EB49E4|tara:strand:- start:245727 stop:246695 length:969 start_codon:yes stop_codon:yes gene_type:complete
MTGTLLRLSGNLRGVLWMTAAMASGVFVDVCAKLVSHDVPTAQILAMRAVTTVVVFLVIVMFIGTRQIRTRRPYAHLARGVLWYGSLFFVFFALRQMSIAEVNAYLFIEALLTVMLAVVILGEKLTARKLIATVLGLVGVWVMCVPKMDGFGVPLGVAAALIGAFCFSAQTLYAKIMTRTETNFSMLFWPQIVAIVIWVPVAIIMWQPAALADWLYSAGAGFFAMLTNYMVLRAVRVADASVISPAAYTALPFSVAMDLIFFDMLPVPIIFIGAAIVVLAVSLLDYKGGAKPVAIVPADGEGADDNDVEDEIEPAGKAAAEA